MKIKNKIYIFSFLFILLALSVAVFFVVPTFFDIREKSTKLSAKKNGILYNKLQAEELENFKKNQEYKISLGKIDNYFIDFENPIDFVKFLEKTAEDSKVKLKISLIPSIKGEKYENGWAFTNFRILANGDFFEILKFAEKIENGPYILRIQEFDIKKAEPGNNIKGNSNLLTASLLIQAFSK